MMTFPIAHWSSSASTPRQVQVPGANFVNQTNINGTVQAQVPGGAYMNVL